ncbi:MAG: hypothetical protein P1U58_14185 [Verrucomicrobiales bacterium]|nr:hypothetical protein [Verrucomicrobiales bacterium]
MSARVQIPNFLAPDESAREIGAFRILGVFELVDQFAQEFQIDHEIAFASLLAGFAHSTGGAFELDSSLGVIRPPFSLLLVTPESDAIWSRIPIRFLVDDFENAMRAFASVNLSRNSGHPNSDPDGEPEAATEDPDAARVARTVKTAQAVYADKVSERISSSSLVAPFPRVPFDHHALLTTPAVGLERSFRKLSTDEKFRLEQALCSSTPIPPRADEESGAAPSFYWQVDRHEAPRLFEQNPWFAGMPFLMLESAKPGVATIDSESKCVSEIHRRCFELFVMRHHAMRRPKTFSVCGRAFQPLQEFLTKAQRWQAKYDTPSPVRPARVAETALHFALLTTILDQKSEPDLAAAHMGLELAKRLHMRHLKTLAKYLAMPSCELPDTEGLSDWERKIYFRICERPGLSRSKLARSFNQLRSAERDKALTSLVNRNLIEFRDGKLYRQEPPGTGEGQEVPLPG